MNAHITEQDAETGDPQLRRQRAGQHVLPVHGAKNKN